MNHYWTWQFNKGIHAFRMVETIAMVERRAASLLGNYRYIICSESQDVSGERCETLVPFNNSRYAFSAIFAFSPQ